MTRKQTTRAMIAMTTLPLLATACTGGPASAGRPASPAPTVSYSACMRTHGVVTFPDPDADGHLPKVAPWQLGVSSTQFRAAQQACQHLIRPSTAGVRQTEGGMLAFARCMRSHGLRNWPDPTLDSDGHPVFDLHGSVDPDAPPASGTADQCAHLLHPPAGQDGVVLCNGTREDGCHHYGRPAG